MEEIYEPGEKVMIEVEIISAHIDVSGTNEVRVNYSVRPTKGKDIRGYEKTDAFFISEKDIYKIGKDI